jgi:predicted adenylyl cyclase CyaB
MKEVEVKAKLRNKEAALKKLEELGCLLGEPIVQSDSIFVPLDIHELPAAIGVPILRIRENNGKYLMTLKIRLSNGLDKQESETEILDPKGAEGIITSVGFKPFISFTKKRRKGKYGTWEVCVDEVPGLGDMIEVEQLTEDGNSEEIQKELFAFLQTLGVTEEDREEFGYDVLMWQQQQQK